MENEEMKLRIIDKISEVQAADYCLEGRIVEAIVEGVLCGDEEEKEVRKFLKTLHESFNKYLKYYQDPRSVWLIKLTHKRKTTE